MRHLAVALTLTPPMVAALACSAWPLNSPPADALHAPTPEKRRLSHLHGLRMRTIPEMTRVAASGNDVDFARRAVGKHVSQAARLRSSGVEGEAVGLAPAGPRTLVVDGIESQGGSDVR